MCRSLVPHRFVHCGACSEPGGMDQRGGLVGATGHTSGGPSVPRQLSPSHNAALASEMLSGLTLHDRRGGPSPAIRHT